MEKEVKFRTNITFQDIENVKNIIESTGFFYDFEIPVAVELVQETWDHIINPVIETEPHYKFVFVEVDNKTVAYSCYGHIEGTEAGYDLYWIATHNDFRGMGIGKQLLDETHNKVKELGAQFIIAETSTIEKYLPTRLFYEKNGYDKNTVINDYYKQGDGKVMYVKRFVKSESYLDLRMNEMREAVRISSDIIKDIYSDVNQSMVGFSEKLLPVKEKFKEIFSLPKVKEEIKRYANGFKGEAKESKEAFLILEKYMRKEEVSDEEKKFFKDQIIDILKGIGVVVPIQLIPLPFVSTILLIVLDETLRSMNVKILPSSFYEKETN